MERKKIKLQTLTPVHIGNGEILKENFDYIKTKDENGIYITPINHNKLFKCLNEKGQNVVLQYTSTLQSGESIKSFIDELPDNKKESCYDRYIWLDTKQQNLAQELREQIYDGFGKPYIPGSSIKGAIRTVIVSRLMQDGRELNLRYNNVLDNITQYLQVSDVMFENGCTDALNMINLNIRTNNSFEDTSKKQLVEAITTGEESSFTIKISDTQKFQVANSIKDLFNLINQHTKRILNNEINFWYDYTEKDDGTLVQDYINACKGINEKINNAIATNSCILRLGHANGWKFITGDWAEKKANEIEWSNIVNRSRPNNNRYTQYPFPKSRRINIVDTKVNLLGFVKLTIEE